MSIADYSPVILRENMGRRTSLMILFGVAGLLATDALAYDFGDWEAIGGTSEGSTCMHYDSTTGTLFVGSVVGFLYYNVESQTWTPREEPGWIGRTVHSVTTHPGQPGVVITGRENAFFKGYLEISDDWGETSQVVYSSQGGAFKDIQNDPFGPDVFYAAGWHDISPGDLMKSTSGGWEWVQLADYIQYAMTEIAMDPGTRDRLFVSGDARVTRSRDGGDTWTQTSAGLPPALGVYCVALSLGDPLLLLASNDYGIYRTTDGGGLWTQVAASDCQHFAFHPLCPELVAAVTFSPYRLLISEDSGATWEDRTDQFPGQHMVDLVFSDDGEWFYVTSANEGVFVRPVFGPWSPISLQIVHAGNQVHLTWSSPYGFPLYNIYRADLPFGPFILAGSTVEQSFSDTLQGEQAFYQVTGEY
jgi:hypothetical protein